MGLVNGVAFVAGILLGFIIMDLFRAGQRPSNEVKR